VREKRIVRESGRGTFATGGPVDRELASMTSFTEEMAERGMQARTAVVSARFDTPSPAAARELQLDPAAPICFIERVRFTGTEPLLLEQVQVPEWRFPGLLELDLATESLYAIFAQRYGVVLTRASETVEPALPDAREARLLGQSSRRPVLILQLTSFTASDEPIEFCRSVVRGDRARYRMYVRSARSPMSVTASDPVV